MGNEQELSMKGLRLYELLIRFKQGDDDSYYYIIKRFAGLINKASYNCYIGMLDEDLRANIYLALFLRLQRYEIPDADTLKISSGENG